MSETRKLAFVLINAEMGGEEEVLRAIEKVEGVEEAYILYGVYDIIAKIRAENIDKLKDVVISDIRRINKVRSTLTMIVIQGG